MIWPIPGDVLAVGVAADALGEGDDAGDEPAHALAHQVAVQVGRPASKVECCGLHPSYYFRAVYSPLGSIKNSLWANKANDPSCMGCNNIPFLT